ncbi:HNH endonuclease signature motif containing protein [uncultured Roseibium sp.]|uniref:HNH endonuclease signature motif containing protein n=1 Tax=uncultured Roseibium sp. TaxID=1936171 RepID=UPI00261E2DB2|nr:HNH endonuclease signature motif containing protein [uncultured Roseibium sp.]
MEFLNENPGGANSGVEIKSAPTLLNFAAKQDSICPCIAEKSTGEACRFGEKQIESNSRRILAQVEAFEPAEAPTCNPTPSQERCLELFEQHEETGFLIARTSTGGRPVGEICGTDSYGYTQVYIDGVAYRAHRIAFKMEYGREPIGYLDHIDGDRCNNRLDNLREVTPWANSLNRIAPATSNTGQLGVHWDASKERYLASIGVGGKTVHLGRYINLCCALAARKHAFGLVVGAASNDNGSPE